MDALWMEGREMDASLKISGSARGQKLLARGVGRQRGARVRMRGGCSITGTGSGR